MNQQYVIIEDVNPPSEMRWVMLPSEVVERKSKQPLIQPTSLPLVPFSQEESLVHRAETAPKRTKFERTLVLVIETGNEAIVCEYEDATLRTPVPHPAIATASQDIPATSVTAQTLLLLTSTPKYDRTATPAVSEHQLSSLATANTCETTF